MANVNEGITVKKDWAPSATTGDWMLANPWLWLVVGFGFALWSFLWTMAYGVLASDGRVLVLALGVLCGSIGLWLRWQYRTDIYLRGWLSPLSLLMGFIFAAIGMGVVALFVMSLLPSNQYELKGAPLFLVLVSTVPACFFAARTCFSYRPDQSREHEMELEVGISFLAMSALCLLGSYALYISAEPTDWDTMRLFLRVSAAVSAFASALTLSTMAVRRLIVSVLFTLHFIGINTAALSAPPAPWIVQQTWMRCFRPYLEFVYLNNAYHFYAPDPGPSSYLWFRVIYEAPEADADGKRAEEGEWYKMPTLDEDGNHQHPVALDYQRFLSLTEAVASPGPLPQESIYNQASQTWEVNPFYSKRWNLQPHLQGPIKVGVQETKQLRIPIHPAIPWMQQVWLPSDGAARLLSSYARCLAHQKPHHPEKPDWKFKSVKIYRVVHWIPPVQWFLNRIPPTDPELYRPFYVGHYGADGRMKVDQDPYLFWLLPSIRDDQNDPDSQIVDYARLHAGDMNYIRRGTDREWVPIDQADKRPVPKPPPQQFPAPK